MPNVQADLAPQAPVIGCVEALSLKGMPAILARGRAVRRQVQRGLRQPGLTLAALVETSGTASLLGESRSEHRHPAICNQLHERAVIRNEGRDHAIRTEPARGACRAPWQACGRDRGVQSEGVDDGA
jgi:hypothetical protein